MTQSPHVINTGIDVLCYLDIKPTLMSEIEKARFCLVWFLSLKHVLYRQVTENMVKGGSSNKLYNSEPSTFWEVER